MYYDEKKKQYGISVKVDEINKLMQKRLSDYIDAYFNKIVKSVGCYNIESEGKKVIEKIDGSYYAILGVPLIPLYRTIKN